MRSIIRIASKHGKNLMKWQFIADDHNYFRIQAADFQPQKPHYKHQMK